MIVDGTQIIKLNKIWARERELVVLFKLSFGFLVNINVPWLFLTVPWLGLQFVVVVLPDHPHLLFIIFDISILLMYLARVVLYVAVNQVLKIWTIVLPNLHIDSNRNGKKTQILW